MAIKKSAIYSSLWESCNQLRGGMDASQYKDYVLTLLFVKYVSDKYEGQKHAPIEIPPGGSFKDIVALKGDKEIGDKINKAIGRLAEANDLTNVINLADFNDEHKLGKGKDMQDCLSKLVSIFNDLSFSNNRADGDDLLGDAYEYLMRHFSTESGKSKGQFYTPAEVSRIMAKVIGMGRATRGECSVYDPTCGSGSLLLKAADEAPADISIYGQEKDIATTALAKMNMILHGSPSAEIAPGGNSTLSKPHFINPHSSELKTFDFVVANPPFSTKAWQNGLAAKGKTIDDPYSRFEYGTPPEKNGDYAFLLHIIKSLKSTGQGAIILPHGVLFRGHAEARIREAIVKRGYIKGLIGLPANLFYGTGIPACIIVLDKKHASARKGIFMIDANRGFIKDGNKNRLRDQDVHKIVDVFNKSLELIKYSRTVPLAEIAKNNYNLNIPRYIDAGEAEDLHDLGAHIQGGIPKRDVDELQAYWHVFKSARRGLFKQTDRADYLTAEVPVQQVQPTIKKSLEYQDYEARVNKALHMWQQKHSVYLNDLDVGCQPKDVIFKLAENLLQAFENIVLIDKYDVYQHLMSYWHEVMQDDVWQIATEGWLKAARLRAVAGGEKPDLVIKKSGQKLKADLIPTNLIVQRYFEDEQKQIDDIEASKQTLVQQVDELIEEHRGEEGLLDEVQNDKGKITKLAVQKRLKQIKGKSGFDDEAKLLARLHKMFEHKQALEAKAKTLQLELDKKILARYDELTLDEVKQLVCVDKWFAHLNHKVAAEVQGVVQRLASRVKLLETRYARPLPDLKNEVKVLEAKVQGHLKSMGVV